jgi:large subunit ribosomal protein L31
MLYCFDEKARYNDMKQAIHPEYKETVIKCACGEEYVTKSTKQNLKVDICSKCHPFYTGKQKLVDSGGRVDSFKKKYNLK